MDLIRFFVRAIRRTYYIKHVLWKFDYDDITVVIVNFTSAIIITISYSGKKVLYNKLKQ